jgi:FkbM family methyltransferase
MITEATEDEALGPAVRLAHHQSSTETGEICAPDPPAHRSHKICSNGEVAGQILAIPLVGIAVNLWHRCGMYEKFKWTRHSQVRNELTRQFEPMQPHVLMGFAKFFRCDTFLDVGSNIGAYAVLMTTCESVCEIHAFEPSPETFAEMVANVRLNSLSIETHNIAASDRSANLAFGIINTFSGANSVVDTSIHTDFVRHINVPAERLDDVLELRGRRLCIKVDVEGHEKAAIAGMQTLLASNDIVLQLERYVYDDDLTKMLSNANLKPICRIGADDYYSNMAICAKDVVSVFESASEALASENLTSYFSEELPLQIRLGQWVSVAISGRAARVVRSFRARLRIQ